MGIFLSATHESEKHSEEDFKIFASWQKFYLCIEKNLTWYLTILLSQNFQNPTLPVFLGLYWRNPLHFVLTGVISSPMECSSGFEENAVVSDMTHNWLYLIQLISSSLQSILLQNVIDLQNSQSF